MTETTDTATPVYTVDGVIDRSTVNDPSDPPPVYAARNKPKEPRNCKTFTKRNIIISIAVLVVVTLIAVLIPLFATGTIWIPSSNQPTKYYPNLCKDVKIHNGTYTFSVTKMLPKGDKVYILCEYDSKDVLGGSIIELDTTKNQTSIIYTAETNFVDLTFPRSVLGENTDRLYSANINGSVQSHEMKTLATTPIEFGGARTNQTVVSFLPYLSRADLFTNITMRTTKTDYDENLLLFYLPDTIANQTSYSAFRGLDISSQSVKSTLSLLKKALNESKFSDISNFTKPVSDFKANPLKMLMISQTDVDVPYLFGYARISPKDDIYLSSLGYSPYPYLPSYMYFEKRLTNSVRGQNDPHLITDVRCPFVVDSLLQVAFQNEQYEASYSSTFGPSGSHNTSSSARIFAVATDSTGKNYALVEFLLNSSPLATNYFAKCTIQSCKSISITRGGLQGDYIAMKMEESNVELKKSGKVSVFFLSWASTSERVIEEWDGNKGKLKASYVVPGNPGIRGLKVSGSNLYVATANELFLYDIKWT
ncbi:hypothetical protein HK098_003862 [Nowakowskiella sp. JEL0407]|nr:hypothetical protein HK098_003862 [Nowakowskiella sp. JEL0407]